ncbi:MAG: hypothetical protein HY712_05720 [candidate division NC10 bacterium]|nr:hypothetical protein [candidate division NC10 bacterium]
MKGARLIDHDGGNGGGPGEIREPVPRRGRDLVTLAGLGAALAALWALTFFYSVQDWGVYRPVGLGSQAPPPAPIIDLLPLTLRETRALLGLAAGAGEDSHDPR